MKKRILTMLMALAMLLSVLPCECFAEEDELSATVTMEERFAAADAVELAVYQEFIAAEEAAMSAALPSGTAQTVYDELLAGVKKIAAGQTSSTEVVLSDACNVSYTAAELGIQGAVTDITKDINDIISAKMNQDLALNSMVRRLLVNCPYELYWFNKTAGSTVGYSIGATGAADSRTFTMSDITYSFTVSQDYAVIDQGSYDPLVINTTRAAAAAAVMSNAAELVANQTGKSDDQRLAAYRDYICNAVSYNHSAAETSGYPYGDPWQLISVFDKDNTTNVVCEGYAKAFKYLCDLTWTGASPAVKCYLVSGSMFADTGSMSGSTGSMSGGPHMWNVVTIGGANYLVDVTNCDTGMVGQGGKLFLCGAEEIEDDYTITYMVTLGNSQHIFYSYDEGTCAVYDTELMLSAETYVPEVLLPISEENFPDLNFRNYILTGDHFPNGGDQEGQRIDGNGDGSLSAAEIAAVENMICCGRGIQDLTGISYFTALKTLDCSGNQLMSLDLSGLAQLETLIGGIQTREVTAVTFNDGNKVVMLQSFDENLEADKVSFVSNRVSFYDVKNAYMGWHAQETPNWPVFYYEYQVGEGQHMGVRLLVQDQGETALTYGARSFAEEYLTENGQLNINQGLYLEDAYGPNVTNSIKEYAEAFRQLTPSEQQSLAVAYPQVPLTQTQTVDFLRYFEQIAARVGENLYDSRPGYMREVERFAETYFVHLTGPGWVEKEQGHREEIRETWFCFSDEARDYALRQYEWLENVLSGLEIETGRRYYQLSKNTGLQVTIPRYLWDIVALPRELGDKNLLTVSFKDGLTEETWEAAFEGGMKRNFAAVYYTFVYTGGGKRPDYFTWNDEGGSTLDATVKLAIKKGTYSSDDRGINNAVVVALFQMEGSEVTVLPGNTRVDSTGHDLIFWKNQAYGYFTQKINTDDAEPVVFFREDYDPTAYGKGGNWLDRLGEPVPNERIDIEARGEGVIITAEDGLVWTELDSTRDLVVKDVLESRVTVTSPEDAVAYRMVGNGTSTEPGAAVDAGAKWEADSMRAWLNGENWMTIHGSTSISFPAHTLLEHKVGSYAYYVGDNITGMDCTVFEWKFADNSTKTEYIYFNASPYLREIRTVGGEGLGNEGGVTVPTVNASEDYTLCCYLYPQENPGAYYLRLLLEHYGKRVRENGEEGYEIYLPYAYFGLTAEQGELLRQAGMKPSVSHYDDGHKLRAGEEGRFEGEYTDKGVKFITKSFSPFVVSTVIFGDVNQNGTLDIQDMQTLYEHLSGAETKAKPDAFYQVVADVNGDESVNILDYQALYEAVLAARSGSVIDTAQTG